MSTNNTPAATIARAKALRLIGPGFVGTFAEIADLVADADAPIPPDEDGSLAYERHLESLFPQDAEQTREELDREEWLGLRPRS